MTGELWFGVLMTFVIRLPSFVVGAVGFWLAYTRRNEHPRVSKFAMVGFGALLASGILFLAIQMWIQYAIENDYGPQIVGVISRWNLVGYPLNLISWVAVGSAVFIDRRLPSNRVSGGGQNVAA